MSVSRRDVDPMAIDKYREFHRFEPRKIGAMKGLVLPARMQRAGVAKWVTYRSDKTDPETLKRPRRPVDYIHEHDAGVHVYLPESAWVPRMTPPRVGEQGEGLRERVRTDIGAGKVVDVPDQLLEPDASLVLLGKCLGFKFDETEAEGAAPLPELYCTTDGKVLLVVQSKRDLLAAMWGGGLGVFARGIDG